MKSGAIGFFDILGYRSFLQNNPTGVAEDVVAKLVKIEESIGQEMLDMFSHHHTAEQAAKILSVLRWLVFSDTILLYVEFEKTDTQGQLSNKWIVLHIASLLLWRRMFAYGLPIRGVIHTGEFVVDRACFAGRAIVEAYELSQDVNAAICAYSPAAFSVVTKHANEADDQILWSYLPAQVFEYQTPRKSGKSDHLFVVNPLAMILEDSDRLTNGDLAQAVFESFSDHNKDIPEAVHPKLRDTELYLRAARFALSKRAQHAKRIFKFRTNPTPFKYELPKAKAPIATPSVGGEGDK